MAKIARAVAPEIPHHVIQRGNGRQQTFFNDEDYQAYLELMSQWCTKFKVQKGWRGHLWQGRFASFILD
jgi:putative transposase